MKKKGFFITFEGIDGSGKSTQIRKLAKFLEDNGYDIIITREPGGSVGGEEIRNLLLQGAVDRWSAETEILLFTAARRDHLERIILPALQGGKIVICDRFTDSTRMYQGMRGPKLRDLVDKLTKEVINCDPDLTIIIDIDNPPLVFLKAAAIFSNIFAAMPDFSKMVPIKINKGTASNVMLFIIPKILIGMLLNIVGSNIPKGMHIKANKIEIPAKVKATG